MTWVCLETAHHPYYERIIMEFGCYVGPEVTNDELCCATCELQEKCLEEILSMNFWEIRGEIPSGLMLNDPEEEENEDD